MAIYLGNKQVDMHLSELLCNLNLLSTVPITNNTRLVTSDGYILKDINNNYLTFNNLKLTTLDNES